MIDLIAHIPIQYLYPIHVVFMTFWIAGLFFVGRMFIYDQQAETKEQSQKEAIQTLSRAAISKSFYIIIWPSLFITTFAGVTIMLRIQAYTQGWFHTKMLFVILLILYTLYSQMYRQKIKTAHSMSGIMLRIFNEVPGLLLILIVFTVYAKNVFAGLSATAVLIFLVALTIFLVKLIKGSSENTSKRKEETESK
ncbi:MAG: CopD family protein [bacterium]